MSTDERSTPQVDPERVELLSAPYREFRALKFTRLSRLGLLWTMLKHQFRPYYFVQPPRWRVRLRARNWRDRPPPDFASVGSVRSGTSALSNYLFQHPGVLLPLVKEPIEGTTRGMRALFPTRREREDVLREQGAAQTGLCTPGGASITYPFMLKAINPDLKVVVILRDPIERAFSHWRWDDEIGAGEEPDVSLRREFPGFDELVELEMADAERGGVGWTTTAGVAGYLKQSIYLPFMTVLLHVFPREQIKVVHAADFFADPIAVTKECYAFLGLPPCEPRIMSERNAAPARHSLSARTRERMREFFEPYNQRLYQLLGRDFGW